METKLKSKAFQEFYEAAETIVNPEIRKWKDGGGKVVGYFCSAMPEEIITAAGMLPFRIRATGSEGTELSDSHFSSINCSFPRHAFNMALQGEYSFMDGLLMFNSCDNIRRMYDNWIQQVEIPFVQILSLPKKADTPQIEFFRDNLAELRDHMEIHFAVEITDDKLWEAIKLHNQTRRLMRSLYELRKADDPPITGADMLAVTVASTAMPKQHFNGLLLELMDKLVATHGGKEHRARLMIIGSLLDNPDYIDIIEDQGGLVVTDSQCFGSRLLWQNVDEKNSDPLMALARYCVMDRPSCPRMYTEYDKRVAYIRNLIRDFKVDGVILERMAFCEVWGMEQYLLVNDFKEWDIPLLVLDREYTMSGIGQLRTRVQAFLETIGR